MKKFYYAFEYSDSTTSTVGDPSAKTGKYSVAGKIFPFKSCEERDKWITTSAITSDGKSKRIAVRQNSLRGFFLGLSIREFEDHLRDITKFCSMTGYEKLVFRLGVNK